MAQATQQNNTSSFLHFSILFDALGSTLGALGFIAIGLTPLTQLMGFAQPLLPLGIGIALIAYIAWLFWLTKHPQEQARQGWWVVTANDLWVIGWVAALAFNWLHLSIWGVLYAVFCTVVVALCGLMQITALLRLKK